MRKNVHVTQRDDGRWAVKRERADRAASMHDTQADAIEAGRDLAINNRSELVIHGRDGKIRDKDSFGNDPHPPKDTKH